MGADFFLFFFFFSFFLIFFSFFLYKMNNATPNHQEPPSTTAPLNNISERFESRDINRNNNNDKDVDINELISNCKTEADLLKIVKRKEIKEVDCCFSDPLGQWQHCSYHPSMVRLLGFRI